MVRSMYSAVSGLKNHQKRMDVIANNIANVNTVAFKSSRVTFQDIYSQTLETASAGKTDSTGDVTRGGTNPKQIGLGVTVGSIDTAFTQAGTQSTGIDLDLAIEGDGFFVVQDGTNNFYTRAGNFQLDNTNHIVNSDGLYLLDSSGDIINTTGRTDIAINTNGEVTGLLSNGTIDVIANIGLATFANPNGLSKAGGNLYAETQNSGAATIAEPGDVGVGNLRSGELELSNVDLASEFTDMITTQRGFQANSRTITTSDTMLEELINLKR